MSKKKQRDGREMEIKESQIQPGEFFKKSICNEKEERVKKRKREGWAGEAESEMKQQMKLKWTKNNKIEKKTRRANHERK